jgi:hypothetical protein
LNEVVNWKNEWIPPNLVHIHGTKDHIFPINYVKADYVIKDGGHLLPMNNANEVTDILKKIL